MHFGKGFSLIELLVVVAIIAILAGIALPTYQKNTTRARVAELVKVLDGLTHQVLISYNSKGKIPDTLENISGLGAGSYSQYIIPELTTHLYYNSGSTWTNNGAMIQISVDSKVGRAIPGFIQSTIGTDGAANSFVMAFVDDGGTIKIYCGRWSSASAQYIPLDYLPTGCKSDDIAALVTGN